MVSEWMVGRWMDGCLWLEDGCGEWVGLKGDGVGEWDGIWNRWRVEG